MTHRDEHYDGDGKEKADDGHGGANGDPRLRPPPQVSQEGESNVEAAAVHTQVLGQAGGAGVQFQPSCSHVSDLQPKQMVN